MWRELHGLMLIRRRSSIFLRNSAALVIRLDGQTNIITTDTSLQTFFVQENVNML